MNDTVDQESKPFSCTLGNQTIGGLVIKGYDNLKLVFDVQVFINYKFYTFCITEQNDRQYLIRLVKVHDRTGAFLALKTLHMTNSRVEQLFEQILTTLVNED